MLLVGVIGLCGTILVAQFTGPGVSTPSEPVALPSGTVNPLYEDARIRIGDVISITTYGVPELTINPKVASGSILASGSSQVEGLKVGPNGEVIVPYLGAVKLVGMTLVEAATYLGNALKADGILTDPQVSVQLVDSPTRVITVFGEVERPALVSGYGQISLLQAISACGGLTKLASHYISIHRPGVADPILVFLGTDPNTTNASKVKLVAGDTVIVPRVGNVYVVGEVKTQDAYPLSGNAPMTVMRVIALAGGLKYSAALSKARIIRTTASNQRVEIRLDLKKLMNGKQQDITLVSDDVLFIPANGFKASVAAGGASVATSLLYGVTYSVSATK
jgi:polysaccharide export outer membrane protein